VTTQEIWGRAIRAPHADIHGYLMSDIMMI